MEDFKAIISGFREESIDEFKKRGQKDSKKKKGAHAEVHGEDPHLVKTMKNLSFMIFIVSVKFIGQRFISNDDKFNSGHC